MINLSSKKLNSLSKGKNVQSQMKIHYQNQQQIWAGKEKSVIFKLNPFGLSNLREKENKEKWIEPCNLVKHCHVTNIHVTENMRKGEKVIRKKFEVVMARVFPYLSKNFHLPDKKLKKLLTG